MNKRRPGNPNWGRRPALSVNYGVRTATQLTEFEQQVANLGLLNEEEVKSSAVLKKWADRNAHRRYVPENLLKFWGIDSDIGWDFR